MSTGLYFRSVPAVLCLISVFLIGPTLGFAAESEPVSAEERWESLRLQLFGEQIINELNPVVLLDAPGRAHDGARVPVTLHASAKPASDIFIQKLYLIVDNNPVPVAGTFEFDSEQQWDTIDTELRVNEYSYMRAVAQMSDGSLHMDARFIKAVGGCSAPPSSYERSDATLLGNFTGGVEELLNPKVPAVARIRLTHPNASGMQFDQFTRTYIPAHYVHTMRAEFNDKLLFTLSTNFSLSQDPVLGFNFRPREPGTLKMTALDSKNQEFVQSWQINGFQ